MPRKKPTTPRPAGRRALNKAATKQRIVDAALQLFQSKGFDSTTTREIARKSKIAEGTVFNYFETKEDIALYFFELETDRAIATVRGRKALAKAPLEEKLFALIESQINFLAPYERFIGSAFVQALKPTSKLGFSVQALALRQRYLAFVEELIAESLPNHRATAVGWWAPQAFWLYYLGILLYWLHDSSAGKQNTLAFLDRSLTFGVTMLRKGVL